MKSPTRIPVSVVVSNKSHKHKRLSNNELEDLLKSGCCSNNCLLKLCNDAHNYTRGIAILQKCRSEISPLSQPEIVDHLKCKLLQLTKEVTSKSRKFYHYTVEYENVEYNMCQSAYLMCYGISSYTLRAAKTAADSDLYSTVGVFNDSTKISDDTIVSLNNVLKKSNINEIDRREVRSLCRLPKSDAALQVLLIVSL